MAAPGESFRGRLGPLDANDPRYAIEVVDALISESRAANASDIHLTPNPDGLDVRWRIDGVLHPIATIPAAFSAKIAARLKVMSDLLTYRCDVPQEGRIRAAPGALETRVSTFPTLHGERVVVRMFASSNLRARPHELGLPAQATEVIRSCLAETSGMLVIAGPAGSGKTTTLYACLRELAALSNGARSISTLEDPIEVAVPGVAQAQVNPTAGFTLEIGLRSLMRQDPEVIGVGEVRDRAVAEVAFQAALTGHLVLTTFHAGSASGAIGRLADMGIEPYLIRSAVIAVVFQRLARKLCACRQAIDEPSGFLGLPVEIAFRPVGCSLCGGTGYHGRIALAEALRPEHGQVGQAVLARSDVGQLEAAALADGMVSRWGVAARLVESGATSPAEVRRILGLGRPVADEAGT